MFANQKEPVAAPGNVARDDADPIYGDHHSFGLAVAWHVFDCNSVRAVIFKGDDADRRPQSMRAGADASEQRAAVERLLRRALALKAELGEPAAAATIELDADPAVASYQAAALAPLGALDSQRLLEQEGPDQRLALLVSTLDEEVRVLAQRASWG